VINKTLAYNSTVSFLHDAKNGARVSVTLTFTKMIFFYVSRRRNTRQQRGTSQHKREVRGVLHEEVWS
jgi:hypothetical protein